MKELKKRLTRQYVMKVCGQKLLFNSIPFLPKRYKYLFLAITNKGKQAYIDQTYHLATANLYQANASRKLSIVAIGVAVAGILLTFLLQFI